MGPIMRFLIFVPGGPIFPLTRNCPIIRGKLRKPHELQGGKDPLILMLARGHLLPKRTPQHLNSPRFLPEDRGGLHSGRHEIATDDHIPQLPYRNSRGSSRSPVGPPFGLRPNGSRSRHPGSNLTPNTIRLIPHTPSAQAGLKITSPITTGFYWFLGASIRSSDLGMILRVVHGRKSATAVDLGKYYLDLSRGMDADGTFSRFSRLEQDKWG